MSVTITGAADMNRGGANRLLLDLYRLAARLVAAITLFVAPLLLATPGTGPAYDPNTLYYDSLATFDPETDRPISIVASRSFTGARTCARFTTHAELSRCYAEGSALLITSPAAKQYDDEFPPVRTGGEDAPQVRVIGAVVYPQFDRRGVAFITRWDDILEEYVDIGGSYDDGWDKGCRSCIWQWSDEVNATIKRDLAENLKPIDEPNLTRYTTAELKYHLSHDEAAAILAKYPDTCGGIFTDIRPQGWFDEDFDPYLAGFLCDVGDLRRVWKWVPETGASYEIAGAFIKSATDERRAAALLRRYLGFRPSARIELYTGMTDKAAAARTAAAAAAADEAKRREQAERTERIKRNVIRYGGGAAIVITPLALLVFLRRAARESARRRRIAAVQDELNQAIERESKSARLLRLANQELGEARARSKKAHEFHANVQKEAKQVIREVKIDE